MRIWRNLDPKLLAQLLIQASEYLKTRKAERPKRPLEAPQPDVPPPSAAGAVKPAEQRHV